MKNRIIIVYLISFFLIFLPAINIVYGLETNANVIQKIRCLGYDTWGYSNNEEVKKALVYQNSMFIAGATGDGDIFLAKLDISNTEIGTWLVGWAVSWGLEGRVYFHDFVLDDAGNSYICGTFSATGPSKVFLLKFNSMGMLLWNVSSSEYYKRDDVTISMALDSVNYILISAETYSDDINVLKYNSSGGLEWKYEWENHGGVYIYDLEIGPSNRVIVSGGIEQNYDSNWDIFVFCCDSSGNLLWNETWGSIETEVQPKLFIDSNSFLYLIGYTDMNNGWEIYLAKIDVYYGGMYWNLTWSLNGVNFTDSLGNQRVYTSVICNFIAESSSNKIDILGSVSFQNGISDPVFVQFDQWGIEQRNITWGNIDEDDRAYFHLRDDSDNIYIVGTKGELDNKDIMIWRMNNPGENEASCCWGGSNDETPVAMHIDAQERIWVVGNTESYGEGNSDVFFAIFNYETEIIAPSFNWMLIILIVGSIGIATIIVIVITVKLRK